MRRHRLPRFAALFLLFCAVSSAQSTSFDSLCDSLSAVRHIDEVALSPDGQSVAWVERGSGIFLTSIANPNPRHLASGRDIVWSPDSRRVAYLSDTSKQAELYITAVPQGSPQRLASFSGYVADPRWSRDGKTIALLFMEGGPAAAGPLAASEPQTGSIGANVHVQRLTTVDVASRTVRPVSPPNVHVYEYDWSPDGTRFAWTAAPPPGDNNWWVAQLYIADAHTGAATLAYKPDLQIAQPRWSPDGRHIAFIQGLMSDEVVPGGDVWVLGVGTNERRNLTERMPATAASIDWLPDGRVLFGQHIDGDNGLAAVDLSSGRIEQLWRGAESVATNGGGPAASFSRDHKTSAIIRQSFDRPPEVWAGATGDWKQISQVNAKKQRLWEEAKNVHWTNDGRQAQGWLLYPRGYDPSRRWPLVVWVHGGPASMAHPHWPGASITGALAASGYFVLFPNPRGSYGWGEEYTQANRRDFGYGDLRDILAGVDELVRTLPIDNNRIGLSGWSYGGFMSMWAVTQTHRFRAAVAGAGISNWISYYGENLIDQWMIPYFGASAYDDPAVYQRSSAIPSFIKNVKTPTLILVGERDAECPAPQSWEFWHALKTLGVDTELVVYPNEGHGFTDPAHQRDLARRAVEWFNRYMK